MAVLYQKYRPQNFSEIVGQNNIKTTLQNEILHNKVSHAYLFCGPRAVGKTTLARVLAKSINCQNRSKDSFEPCNECDSCLSISNFSNLDVIEIDAASNTGVDNVRDNIIALSRVKSSNNNFKVFIIDEVHMLSLSAFNALLKTLEEPPKNVIFILCTTEIYKVPATIISRCERFDFKRISLNDMVTKLDYIIKNESLEVDREVLELIALKSGGHLRDAESLLSQIIAISGDKINLDSANLIIPYNNIEENINFLEALSRKDVSLAIKMINDISGSGVNLKNFLNDLIELLRKMILNKVSDSLSSNLGLDLNEKLEIKINNVNKNFSLEDLVNITEELLIALKELPNSFIPQMPIELAIINISHINTLSSLEAIKNISGSDVKKISNVEDSSIRKEKVSKKNISGINLDEIENRWPEFLNKLKPLNHSLSFVLQSCNIDGVDGKKICLSFKYKFHKDRLDSPEIKKIIEGVLKDVYKNDLSIEALVNESMEIKKDNNKDSGEVVDNLLKTFGGQIIN